MNNGLSVATGEYIIFLHSDDYFHSNESLSLVSQYFSENDGVVACDILYGKNLLHQSPRGFNFWLNFKTGILHQGAVCHRSVFDKVGLFDEQFKIAMDYDFFLRAYRHKISINKYSIILSVMRDTGISSRLGWGNIKQRLAEEQKVHIKNCPNKFVMRGYLFYWYMYTLYKRIMCKLS